MNGDAIWSQFEFENRKALTERNRHLVVGLMKLIDDDDDVNVDVEELYKVTTPCNNRWFIVNGVIETFSIVEEMPVPCSKVAKVMFAVITQPVKKAKQVFIERVTHKNKSRRNRTKRKHKQKIV